MTNFCFYISTNCHPIDVAPFMVNRYVDKISSTTQRENGLKIIIIITHQKVFTSVLIHTLALISKNNRKARLDLSKERKKKKILGKKNWLTKQRLNNVMRMLKGKKRTAHDGDDRGTYSTSVKGTGGDVTVCAYIADCTGAPISLQREEWLWYSTDVFWSGFYAADSETNHPWVRSAHTDSDHMAKAAHFWSFRVAR